MARSDVTVREAGRSDIPALLGLWRELREEGLRRRTNGAESDEQVTARFGAALADPESRVLVAVYDDAIIGMAQLVRTRATLLTEGSSVELSAMHVADAHRRRGAGKALVTAAVTYADELAADSVVVSVFPQHRDANRFYARLGFAPMVVRRVAPVAALRRRLGTPEGRAALLRRELHVPRRSVITRNRARRVIAPAPVGDRPE
ncbi:MAG TPA: GNAT family N-acetyltransferase [Frankiaceae bacterium]|nr:GNAT family N-acetyltransferase [Frankiaceae bacterium]